MSLPLTRKILEDWAGTQVFQDGVKLWERGTVIRAEFDPPTLRGVLEIGTRQIRSALDVLPDGTADNRCPCHTSRERGLVCVHVVALGLEVVRREHDPHRQEKLEAERRKAARLAAQEDGQFLRRVPADTPKAVPLRLTPALAESWQRHLREHGTIPIQCYTDSPAGRRGIGELNLKTAYSLTPADEALLYVLEDICEGPVPTEIAFRPVDFLNLLDLLRGRTLGWEGSDEPVTINAASLASHLLVDLDRDTGEVIVMVRTEMPFLKAADVPQYVVTPHKGWAYGATNFWPLESVLPGPLQSVYHDPIIVPRPAVPRFLKEELPLLARQIAVETDLSADLLTIDPEPPRFQLRLRGSPAALSAELTVAYGQVVLPAAKADPAGLFAHPDPEDLLRYTVRHLDAEEAGLDRLRALGWDGDAGDDLGAITGTRTVGNFLGRDLPALRRRGWRVTFEGRIRDTMEETAFVAPVVQVHEDEGSGWFEVAFSYEDGAGGSLSAADIQRALRKGEHFLERDGRTLLIDGEAIESMNRVFEDCAGEEGRGPGQFRLDPIHAAYVKASLDALDGIDVDADPAWLERARNQCDPVRLTPVPLPESLDRALRGYQKDGVHWLAFLERSGFAGILADEMGLGKTLQTLTWLRLPRAAEEAAGRPALVVCPTSLVENWAEEAARWVPDAKVAVLAGTRRAERYEEIPESDLVIISYALLRRDIDRLREIPFAAAVLDEAQHIKNRSTQNAKAVKCIRAVNRLVLTGTPVENSVADLWSIMDFLMPGYLGAHQQFRDRYELPIGRGGSDGEEAQHRLRRKLHPFLLRRLKRDVAKDLPPKIQRIAKFTMSADQQHVYQELLQASQRRLLSLVQDQGFHRSRMEIFKTLLRLRQVCCHLDLLKLPDLKAEAPSAKLDLFLELLDEALDGGHRILVFSQFTSMLAILRRTLEERDLPYCYLDGSTVHRMEQVHRFNRERDIPVFLISLKAGGTGLNLTGADMVIHYDPWWNPAVEDQATDRAYRIGQKRTVYSIKLIARDSVEEKVLAMQERKKKIIEATLATDEKVMERLDWEDVKELLSL